MSEVNDFKQLVEKAIKEFIKNEGELLEMDVSERCITHSFANYLDKCISCISSNLRVDVEYNRRHIKDIKTTEWEVQPRKFIPDIVVHKRKTDENKLAVEIKKSTNKNKMAHESDKSRLGNLVESKYQYHYEYGLYLLFKTGKDYSSGENAVNYEYCWYQQVNGG